MKTLLNTRSKSGSKKQPLEKEMVVGNKYVLKSFAGKGGMGEVWRAWDVVGRRFVALKFISTDVGQYATEMNRMQEAFRATSELNHQNICPMYGLEFDPKYGLYLAMKWLGGYPLDDVVKHNKERRRQRDLPARFPRPAIPKILKSVADALDYSHVRGVIHRDVKPSNVFLEIKGSRIIDVYLIDFGLALLTQGVVTYESSGTCLYMPPEQWLGKRQTGKTDQYSLAALAYELYAGKPPFLSNNLNELRCSVLHDTPPSIKNLPEEVNEVLRRGLSKKYSERYETCGEFVRELENAAKNIQYESDESEEIYTPKKLRMYDDKDDDAIEDEMYTLDDLKKPTLKDTFSDKLARAKAGFTGIYVHYLSIAFFVFLMFAALGAIVGLVQYFFRIF